MAVIKPFKALRPKKEIVDKLASPPYDVLNKEEAITQAKDNQFSFLHITKSEIDLSTEVAPNPTTVHEKAARNLKYFCEKGYLFQEEKPCYYIYRLVVDGKVQTGLACASSIAEYTSGIIKKHELTRPDKEKDRTNHMVAVQAQTGKVFLAYRRDHEIQHIIESWTKTHAPEYDFIAVDNVQHTVWVVNDDNTIKSITDLFECNVAATYIADGHHRAASAAKVSELFPENKLAQYFLTVIFPDNELHILDYNRVVKDLNGLSKEAFISAIQDDFEITLCYTPIKPERPHEFGMYLKEQWYSLKIREDVYYTDPIEELDISILSKNILGNILGIKNQRANDRIDFVGGIRGLKELQKRVDSDEMMVAFSIYPVSIGQLFSVADKSEVMPPKSTWFEPKLRDGLLTYLLT